MNNYISLLDENSKNPITLIKAIYTTQLSNYINQYFISTRDYENGLDFTGWALNIIKEYSDQFTVEEFEKVHIELIYNKLNFLDYLNRWAEYLEYYNYILNSTKYSLTYSRTRSDDEFNKFVLNEDVKYKYVHFLFLVNHRHSIIIRKFDKWIKGNKVEHLKRHQQDKLSEKEINDRAIDIITSLKKFIESNN